MSTTETPPKVTRVGNLTRDPELRYSAKGAAWVTTAMAVDRRKRCDDGTWEDDLAPEFYDVVCFGDLAENVATCLSKGDRVVAVGKIEERQWTGRDGVERTGYKLVADDIGASLRHGTVEVNRTSRRGPADLDRIIAAQTADELFSEVGT
jgi:single-strand DNA-binding protein